MKKLIYLLPFVLVLFSCSNDKDKDDQPEGQIDNEKIITIYSPTENQEFQNGDSLNIHAKISYEYNLHGYAISVLNSNEDTLFSKIEHWHGHELDLQEKWKINVTPPENLKVQVAVVLDHDGNTESEGVNIKVVK